MEAATLIRGKPDPEIFLRAAELLGLRPEDCVGVEDARAGIEAIKASRASASRVSSRAFEPLHDSGQSG